MGAAGADRHHRLVHRQFLDRPAGRRRPVPRLHQLLPQGRSDRPHHPQHDRDRPAARRAAADLCADRHRLVADGWRPYVGVRGVVARPRPAVLALAGWSAARSASLHHFVLVFVFPLWVFPDGANMWRVVLHAGVVAMQLSGPVRVRVPDPAHADQGRGAGNRARQEPRHGGGGEHVEVALPRPYEPRAAHAAQCHHRLLRRDEDADVRRAGAALPATTRSKIHAAARTCTTSSTTCSTCRGSRPASTRSSTSRSSPAVVDVCRRHDERPRARRPDRAVGARCPTRCPRSRRSARHEAVMLILLSNATNKPRPAAGGRRR